MNYYSSAALPSFEVFYTLGSIGLFFFLMYIVFTKFVRNVGKSYYEKSKNTDSETLEDVHFHD